MQLQFRHFVFGCFILLGSISSFAQQVPQALMKHNLFFIKEKNEWKPYLEVYFEIDPRSILFEKTKDSFRAKIRTDLLLYNEKGIINQDHYFLETKPVTSAIETFSLKIMDLRRLSFSQGKIFFELKLTDELNKENPLLFHDTIDCSLDNSKPFFSDIQIVDTIINSSKESIFSRNNLIQIPAVSNFFEEKKRLKYYAELYQPAPIYEHLSLKAFISKKENGDPIYSLTQKDSLSEGAVSIIHNEINIAVLPSGNYFLNLSVEDSTHQVLATKSLFFQVMNKSPEVVKASENKSDTDKEEQVSYFNLSKTFLAKYTPAQIRAILKMLLPIAEPVERNRIDDFLNKTDEMYSRYFIYNFWMSRDKSDPEKAWKEYAEKVKVVNRMFGNSIKPGYESDRGIIQLRYGLPTDRVVVNSEEGALPYEIWQYNSLPRNGNAIFLFYKSNSSVGNYELLHSTVVGEKRNMQWRKLLYMNETNNNQLNSKAEYYLGSR